MGERDRDAIARGLERLMSRGVDPSRDGDLLERFRLRRDEAAFEALVTRHGPMVRGVCRRLLIDPADVDDAFQATFLVLARKGPGLRDPDRLGPWLYGVASRVAAKARSRSARRRSRPLTDDIPAREDSRAEWSDVMPILDAELARLPALQRDALVACLLNGASEREAARAFGCPVGTIKSRLSRAREALRSRLVRRGIAPASALAAASSPGSFASPVSAPLLRATLSLVAAPAAVPRRVAALTPGVAPVMISRTLLATIAAGGMVLVGLSATAWIADPPPQEARPAAPSAGPSPEDGARLDRNLKHVLLALHNYEAANAALPPAAIRSADGRPLLSWRVAILPYLDGQSALYKEFRLDEPWDSPHNRPLIERMPPMFQTPGFPARPGETRIRGVEADGALFGKRRPVRDAAMGFVGGRDIGMGIAGGMAVLAEGDAPGAAVGRAAPGAPPREGPEPKPGPEEPAGADRGLRFEDVTDGLSNTIAVVVAEDAVEWTRPGDLEIPGGLAFNRPASLPALVEDGSASYIVGLADGSVRRIPNRPGRREIFLPALLTISGGEVISADVFAANPPAPDPPAASAPEPKAPAAFERRLRRVEEKLDEILERLDALAPPKP